MAKKKEAAAEVEKNYKEFKQTLEGIGFSGRFYPDNSKDAKIRRHFVNLEFAEGFSIKCHLVETKDNYFFSFPQYSVEKNGKTEFKNYCYVEKESIFNDALDKLSDYLYETYLK